MAYLAPTTDRILGGKKYIKSVDMMDQDGNATQGILDISRINGGMIQIDGMSIGVDSVKIKGTVDKTVDSTHMEELPLGTDAKESRALATVLPIGAASASVASNAIKTDCFVHISDKLSQIQLEVSGVTTSGIDAWFTGKGDI